jgi:hypothetical protein
VNDRLRALLTEGEWQFGIIFGRAVVGALQLTNGWIFCSVRYCIDPNLFDMSVGKQYVKDDIVEQLISYEAYLARSQNIKPEPESWYRVPLVTEIELEPDD